MYGTVALLWQTLITTCTPALSTVEKDNRGATGLRFGEGVRMIAQELQVRAAYYRLLQLCVGDWAWLGRGDVVRIDQGGLLPGLLPLIEHGYGSGEEMWFGQSELCSANQLTGMEQDCGSDEEMGCG